MQRIRKNMKKSVAYVFTLVALAIIVAMSLPNSAAAGTPTTAPGQNKLVCLASGDATCILNTKGAKGSATLTVSGDGAASLYYTGYNASIYGVVLSQVTQLSFTYIGTPTAGAPRFSVPIDEGGTAGTTNAFAFIAASTCNNGAGLVDVINNPNCTITYATPTDGFIYHSYANWAAFAAAWPTAEVALTDNYVFVIADEVGTWTINNVVIGKPGK
jgi:hypothetical protein